MNPISLIVTTYNRPQALALVLKALAVQTVQNFEVIIADDGSKPETKQLLKTLKHPYPLHHVWQQDQGFRAAMARNRAVAKASGEYLIFLDGDCIPRPNFVEQHWQLAEKNCFVVGNRILLNKTFSEQIIQQQRPIWQWQLKNWFISYFRKEINRLLPLLYLPFNLFRKLKHEKWQGAKTCNLAVWKKDFLKINGFNENFQGWGHEDADLVIRLLRSGIQRKEGRFALPVFHLWHPFCDRSQENKNQRRLKQILQSQRVFAPKGLSQYLGKSGV